MTTTTIKAWTIDSCSDEGHGFLGVFWFYPGMTLHAAQAGMTIALFRTRRVARNVLEIREVKRAFPKARVARVTVTISG